MPPKTATQIRVGRVVALFAKFQTAKATIQNSFAVADRLWQNSADIDQGPRVNEPTFSMEDSEAPHGDTAYVLADRPQGAFVTKATPTSLQNLIQSNFGPFASGSWTLATQVIDNRWLTLALMEDVAGGTFKVVRLRDVWIHTLSIMVAPGLVNLECMYVGEKQLEEDINAGGVTLPAAPAQPSDQEVFPFRNATLTRDPTGTNVDLRFDTVKVTLNQKLSYSHNSCTGLWEASRKGPIEATIEVEASIHDETWVAIVNSRAGTPERYRLVCISDDASPQTLTIDLFELVWNFAPVGHDGKAYNRYRARAIARTDSGGNNVTLSLA